jgi:hypothetical protein
MSLSVTGDVARTPTACAARRAAERRDGARSDQCVICVEALRGSVGRVK